MDELGHSWANPSQANSFTPQPMQGWVRKRPLSCSRLRQPVLRANPQCNYRCHIESRTSGSQGRWHGSGKATMCCSSHDWACNPAYHPSMFLHSHSPKVPLSPRHPGLTLHTSYLGLVGCGRHSYRETFLYLFALRTTQITFVSMRGYIGRPGSVRPALS